MTKKQAFSTRRVVALVGSQRFFWITVGFLIVQAAWIALSGRYPMAFDEDFHLGIIRLYAHHLSPFWIGHPEQADAFGAVARDPSYLYHYLMSFPYRLISAITDNVMAQVLFLRALNIALFVSFLAVMRQLLLRTRASQTIVHACLLVFVLIPVVPLLAAQINYDNLWLPLTALILLLTYNFQNRLHRRRAVDVRLLGAILGLCLVASLVKYASLPIFIAVLLFLAIRLRQVYETIAALWVAFKDGMAALSVRQGVLLAVMLVVIGGLFVERYGINLVRYHTPVPDCDQVLTVKQCSAYGPWQRDYNLSLYKTAPSKGPVAYGDAWLKGMWRRLIFAVDGPTTQFQTRGPLSPPARGSQLFIIAAAVLVPIYIARIWRRYDRQALVLLGGVSACYVGVLFWLTNYPMYVHTGQAVAVNGRYLLPVLPFLLLLGALAFNEALKHRVRLKMLAVTVAVGSLLWGGGALTYILRSNDAWYWPHSPLRSANHAVQRTIGPLTPGYDRPSQFLIKSKGEI